MALQKKKLSEIPPDAVMLSESEAIEYHYKLLRNWKNKSDVFALNYGPFILGFASALSGAYLNNYFRMKLKLFSYGTISSYLPLCTVPAIVSAITHHEMVSKDLILLKQDQCPVCLEIRASSMQALFGFLVPLALAPISSMGLAQRYFTYNLPSIRHEPLQLLKLIGKFINQKKNVLFGIMIGHALLGSAVTYFEARSIYNVHSKLAQLERDLEREHIT